MCTGKKVKERRTNVNVGEKKVDDVIGLNGGSE
jgi:hypothetical protein